MRKPGLIAAALIAMALSLVLASPALGLTVSVDNPDAAYLARTTKLDYASLPDFTSVANLTDGNLSVGITPSMQRTQAPGWTWGTAGQVEDTATGLPLLWSEMSTSVTLELDRPVYEFGFEGANNIIDTPQDLTATFIISNDDRVIATVAKTVTATTGTGNVNARLFAIRSETPFDKIEVVTGTTNGLIMAQLRYSETPPPLVTVAGIVKNGTTGVGVPFAHLGVEHAGSGVADVEADFQGRYSLELLPGEYTFYIDAPGWSGASEAVTVPEASPYAKDFELNGQYWQAVYRFFNMKAGVHFYTANDAEFINTLGNLGSTFKYDGIAYSVDVGGRKGEIPLYRFYNKKVGVHFYTSSETEKANVIANYSDRYVYEGVAYNVRNDGHGSPVYRYYVPSRNTHFYTVDTSEISLRSGLSSRYQYEGVAYYVGGKVK